MEDNKLILDTNEKPRNAKEWIFYPIQMVMAVFVATVLIATICGTPIDVCLLGGCFGTLIYQICTKFKSPMFISNSGATVSAVIGALALGNAPNYLAVAIGGIVIALIYILFAFVIKWKGISFFNKLFPATIVGPITIVIGLNLATFIPAYVGMGTETASWGVCIAICTMLIIAVTSKYATGFKKTIPFLIGLAFGYILCLCVELIGWANFNIISTWSEINGFFNVPDFAFLHWNFADFEWSMLLDVLILFAPVSICALLEHYSDHKVLSNIIGKDLTEDPGLHRSLIGDGIASMFGTWVCGLPNTSYGESTATIGFSKVASVIVSTVAALFLGTLAFIEPVQVFLRSVPSCVFGGCAMILYGYIACSGLKTLMNSRTDLEDTRNLIVTSVILTVGVSGIFLGLESLTGVSLAMVLGVLINFILGLRDKQ
jgi:uracil permease